MGVARKTRRNEASVLESVVMERSCGKEMRLGAVTEGSALEATGNRLKPCG